MRFKRIHLLAGLLSVVWTVASIHHGFEKGRSFEHGVHVKTTIELPLPADVPARKWWREFAPHFERPSLWWVDRTYTKDEVLCLTQNIFFESRNQQDVGMVGVGWVVLNRSRDKRWPTDLCKVVRDSKHGRQFSWYWDGKDDLPIKSNIAEMDQWRLSKHIAKILTNDNNIIDPTNGSVFYISAVAAHKNMIAKFGKLYEYTTTLDDHIFYK